MAGGKVPPAQRVLRKSVSFSLPSNEEPGDAMSEKLSVPERLLLMQNTRRALKSAPISACYALQGGLRSSSAQVRNFPSPPTSSSGLPGGRSERRPVLRRSLSVPTGLTLANVLTRQRSDALNVGQLPPANVRSRRYSSSSMVKRRLVQHSEREFNKVAAKVGDFCRRMEGNGTTNPALLEEDSRVRGGEARTTDLAPDQAADQAVIRHHGRRYRASFSLSSNSMDGHSDHLNGSSIPRRLVEITPYETSPKAPPITNNNDPQIIEHIHQPEDDVVNEYTYCNGELNHNDDDEQCELNDRISKWLDDVNNSVGDLTLAASVDDDDGDVTISPLN